MFLGVQTPRTLHMPSLGFIVIRTGLDRTVQPVQSKIEHLIDLINICCNKGDLGLSENETTTYTSILEIRFTFFIYFTNIRLISDLLLI